MLSIDFKPHDAKRSKWKPSSNRSSASIFIKRSRDGLSNTQANGSRKRKSASKPGINIRKSTTDERYIEAKTPSTEATPKIKKRAHTLSQYEIELENTAIRKQNM